MAPGGYVCLVVPHERGNYARQDPRHLTVFNDNSFLYYTHAAFARTNPDIHSRFQLVHREAYYPSADFRPHDMLVMRVDLSALKGQRQPGRAFI